jgi:hypothetical protein
MWGAIGGVASFGIGSAFGPTGSFLNEVGRAAAHGTSSGLQSHIQGGSFGNGFLAGSISSGLSSGATAANFGDAAMIGVGALGGGIGSSIGGGSFLGGFSQGLAVGAFNHAMHKSMSGGPGDPPTEEQILNAKLKLTRALQRGEISHDQYWLMDEVLEHRISGNNWLWILKQSVVNNRWELAATFIPIGRVVKPFKSISKKYLAKNGIKDIHAFKEFHLGTNRGLRYFDVVKATGTGELFIIRKETQQIIIETGKIIK